MTMDGKFAGERVAIEREWVEMLACGRIMSEEIESISKYGNHGASPILRSGVLASYGIQSGSKGQIVCDEPAGTTSARSGVRMKLE